VTTPPLSDAPVVDFRVRLPHDRRPAVEVPASLSEGYDAVLGMGSTYDKTTADLDRELTTAGVTHAVVHAEYELGDVADALNETTAMVCADDASRIGFGTVSLDAHSASRMVRQVRRVEALGLRGINLQPSFFGRAIDDPLLYAVYAAAEEAGLVVAVHTGVNYSRAHPIDGEQPVRLDRIACAFESLRLVACHAAWPWTAELAAVARRHPQVYVEFGGVAPKYVNRPGTGWEPLRSLMDNVLADQVLFASDWPALTPQRCLQEWRESDLKPTTLARLCGGNAQRLLAWP
jgi:predicted TIM-barrel fold metal-dependent hydrolase